MKETFVILIALLVPAVTLATQQEPDKLIYDGLTLGLSTGWGHPSPLETYYHQNNIQTPFKGYSTGNYRGHVALWEIVDANLYLAEIRTRDYDPNTNKSSYIWHDPNEYGVEPTSTDPAEDGSVFADWFSGVLDCYSVNEGSYTSYFFHVREGSIVETQIITQEDYDRLYDSPGLLAMDETLRRKYDMLVLNEDYITYYYRLNENDEIECAEQDCRLNTSTARLSPIFGFYDNNHLNWPYNWENTNKSGAPHCKWLIEDDKLYLTGVELYSGLSFYEINTHTVELTTLFDDKVIDGVVDANWVGGVYLIKHGEEVEEGAGWPGLTFTVFNVTEYTYMRVEQGQILESYNVPEDFDPENLPEDADQGLIQIVEDYRLPTIHMEP